jgi:crotonobetainyl-CoA:carnitine CoA-transferase CaiB-like acyl-CoA transferase
VSGEPPPRLGNAHPNIVPYQSFETRDGHVIIAIGTDRQFREFCRIAGLEGVPEDLRFATNRARVQNRAALIPIISKAMHRRSTQEWVEALEDAAVPCGPINRIDEVFADPQVRHRRMRVDLERQDGVKTPGIANPLRLSRTPVDYDRPPPALGADTMEVLTSVLGLDEAKIAALKKAGVVG